MKFISILWFGLIFALEGNDLYAGLPMPGSPVKEPQKNIKQIQDSLRLIDSIVKTIKSSNNDLSIRYARRGLVLSRSVNSPEDISRAYLSCGIAFFRKAKDSSFYYTNLAYKLSDENNLLTIKTHAMYNLASIYENAYDYKKAIMLFNSVIILADSLKDYSLMANAYNTLGILKYDIHDSTASKMFDKALSIAKANNLFAEIGVALAALAQFEEDIPKKNSLNKEALFWLKKGKGTEEQMAMTLNNIGYIAANPDTALFYYKAAIELARAGNIAEVEIGAYNNMAYSYKDKGDLISAEKCLRDNAIPLAIKENNRDLLYSLYDTYSDILVAKGLYKEALDYQKRALSEKLAADTAMGSREVRLLSIMLDVKNKELKIQSSEKELLIQNNKLQAIQFWLAVSLFAVFAIILGSLWLQQRFRIRMHRQQVNSAKRIIEMEESEKGRTARELHDITGQLVMGILGEIEGMEFLEQKNKEGINAKIKSLGQSIRQISHKMNPAMIEHFTFSELITGLCEDIAKLADMKVNLTIPEEMPELANEMVLHIYRIVQELLTNASKYAKNSRITLNISKEGNKLRLFYSDNGAGFHYLPDEKAGMGILNIFERAKLVGGNAQLHTAPGKGTTWEIGFPFERKNLVNI